MLYHAIVVGAPPHGQAPHRKPERTPEPHAAFRLQLNVREHGSNLPGTSSRYYALDDAREAARELLRDGRLAGVTIVVDTVPPRFVEWVNR
jgi:hypothetical protein